jgi:hypothetical protein
MLTVGDGWSRLHNLEKFTYELPNKSGSFSASQAKNNASRPWVQRKFKGAIEAVPKRNNCDNF